MAVRIISQQLRQQARNLQAQTKNRLANTQKEVIKNRSQRTLRQLKGMRGLTLRRKNEALLKNQKASLHKSQSYYTELSNLPTEREHMAVLRHKQQEEIKRQQNVIRLSQKAIDRGIPTSYLNGDVYRMVKRFRKGQTLQNMKLKKEQKLMKPEFDRAVLDYLNEWRDYKDPPKPKIDIKQAVLTKTPYPKQTERIKIFKFWG